MSLRIGLGSSTFPTFKYQPKLEQILMRSFTKYLDKSSVKNFLSNNRGDIKYCKSQKTER
jgi:hypothetical protein